MTGSKASTSGSGAATAAQPVAAGPARKGFALPAGPYRFVRMFFNFYILAACAFVGIALMADFIVARGLKEVTEDYIRRSMSGTVFLIEEDIFSTPRSKWQQTIERMNAQFVYPLAIVERSSLSLPPKQEVRLDSGLLASDASGDIVYSRLRNTSQVIVLGPLSSERNPKNPQHGVPLELRIQLLAWGLNALVLGVAVWFWARPIWRDIETLRRTARSIAEGNFGARAPSIHTPAFGLLTSTLNGMADQIQRLLTTQKEMSNAISHELRTPIARIRFALEMLTGTDSIEERQRLWRMMESDLDELDQLIDTSLTYARFEREQQELHRTGIHFVSWLEKEVNALRFLGRELKIEVDCSAIDPGLELNVILRMLNYALHNLLRNAIKYARTEILVTALVEDGKVVIHIDDDGIGIPEEAREHIFTAFVRLDRSRDRATGGYGLGLTITRRAMELHGGSAAAHDSPLGGARFTLAWPLD
ncbi:MAG: ATP-binding protein [Betaproteobacteria bacterium]|nr:ATP-binding protein [Betaproteobacteria bacterium]